jgi:hypothetical protein
MVSSISITDRWNEKNPWDVNDGEENGGRDMDGTDGYVEILPAT